MDKTFGHRPDFHLKVVQDISDLINKSAGLGNILEGVVNKISESLHYDVVSVYLWDQEISALVLKSTIGLHIDPEKPISLNPGEGLTGIVYKDKRPIIAMPASKHPDYKFFPESGEEEYESYIGVPIVLHNKCVGVLVGQTRQFRAINPAEETLFLIIASRLAGLLEVADSLERLRPSSPEAGTKVYQGKGASAGFAVGHVQIHRGLFQEFSTESFESKGAVVENKRLDQALQDAEEDLENLIHRLAEEGKLTEAEVNIFDAHLLILKDPSLKDAIVEVIENKKLAAENAVIEGIESIASHFENLDDKYLRERAHDFRDIGERVLMSLLRLRNSNHTEQKPPDGSIIVGYELGPSFISIMQKSTVKAIVMEKGGEASHATILARSLGIPAVYGIENISKVLEPGQEMLVDGLSGFVFIDPSAALIQEYENKYKKQAKLKRVIEREARAGSKSGIPISLTANIGFPVDVEMARQYKLNDVGLFRTEFAFTLYNSWPTIDEQVEIYSKVAEKFKGYTTVRTLDIGADKPLAYFDFPPEENPLLGLRAVRFSMEYLDLFRDQIKAILLAVKNGNKFRILLPLVSHIWEVETAKEIIEETGEEIGLPGSKIPPLGIMMEVPALVYQLDDFSELVDFVSVGTNDLIQYLLAVDRNSNIVGHLFSSFHPSVIRTLNDIMEKWNPFKKEVNVCGEMAATPMGALSLIALGYRNFSVMPSRAPLVRHLAQHMDEELIKEVRERIINGKKEPEIRRYLSEVLTSIDPALAEFELD